MIVEMECPYQAELFRTQLAGLPRGNSTSELHKSFFAQGAERSLD